jgi:gluconokinase
MDDRQQDRPRVPEHAPAVLVMGVAGCGKTAIGEALAARLGCRFIEGDRLHPPENVARMASGQPLTDELRAGWLDRIGAEMAVSVAEGQGVVSACSALKRIYRDRLRGFVPGILFVYPEIDPETARQRVASRKGHFMPASLVDSQFATLQPPEPDENALRLNGRLAVEELVERATKAAALL